MSKTTLPTADADDNWAKVELMRWQLGRLPRRDDNVTLDVPLALRNMADAVENMSEESPPPSPLGVMTVLRYCANHAEKKKI